ncbi:MAG: class I SAM-dependent methyltransferase [Nitrospirota bacterium]
MYELEDTYWWFLAKHSIVKSFIHLYYGSNTRDAYVLDIGCGTGAFLDVLDGMGFTTHGLDISEEALQFCVSRGKSRIVAGNVEKEMPFRNKMFDVVTGLDVIEHVDDYQSVIAEACRVLKPGGILLITMPAFKFLWNQHDEVHHHKRRFVRKELKAAIDASGEFDVLKLSYYNFFLFPFVCIFRILKKTFHMAQGQKDDFVRVPPLINKSLFRIFSMEFFFLKHISFPFGVSIIAMLQKRGG